MKENNLKKIDLTSKENFFILSRILTKIENYPEYAEKLLANFYDDTKSPIIVGITGTPGAGKSTLMSILASHYCKKFKIAILAIDPSSPVTKGAFLGDRCRFTLKIQEKSIFLRSVSTKGEIGGLSHAVYDLSAFLAYAGFNMILIETCGVGQSESDVRKLSDIMISVLQKDTGDFIQAMKAGLNELSDLILVNKSDLGNHSKFADMLRYSMPSKKILETSAINNNGITEFIDAVQERITSLSKSGKKNVILAALLDRMAEKEKYEILKSLEKEISTNKNPYQTILKLKKEWKTINHIALATKKASSSVAFYREILGLPFDGEEIIKEEGIKAFFFRIGQSRLEILEPLSEENSFSKSIMKRGEGIHHIAINTHDLTSLLDKLSSSGIELIDKKPRKGAHGTKIAFIHPKATHGVLIELVEAPKENF